MKNWKQNIYNEYGLLVKRLQTATMCSDVFNPLTPRSICHIGPYRACARAFSVEKALRECIDNIDGFVSQIQGERTLKKKCAIMRR